MEPAQKKIEKCAQMLLVYGNKIETVLQLSMSHSLFFRSMSYEKRSVNLLGLKSSQVTGFKTMTDA